MCNSIPLFQYIIAKLQSLSRIWHLSSYFTITYLAFYELHNNSKHNVVNIVIEFHIITYDIFMIRNDKCLTTITETNKYHAFSHMYLYRAACFFLSNRKFIP